MTRAEMWGWRVGCVLGAELGHAIVANWPAIESRVWHLLERVSN